MSSLFSCTSLLIILINNVKKIIKINNDTILSSLSYLYKIIPKSDPMQKLKGLQNLPLYLWLSTLLSRPNSLEILKGTLMINIFFIC